MSAREELRKALVDAMQDANWHMTADEDHAKAKTLIEAFAHELAEQQRTEMRAPGRSYDASRWNRCVGMTADLIDPSGDHMTILWNRTNPGSDLTGRTRHRWHVEGWENGEWGMVASASDTLPEAQRKQAGVARRVPGLTMRIIRETTAYTVDSTYLGQET